MRKTKPRTKRKDLPAPDFIKAAVLVRLHLEAVAAKRALTRTPKMVRRRRGLPPVPLWPYACREDFVAKEGRPYIPAMLHKRIKPGKPQDCFFNALELASIYSDLVYVEGYSIHGGWGEVKLLTPVHHAWCALEDGTVIDNTVDGAGEPWRGLGYLGVPFDWVYVTRIAHELGRKGKKFGGVLGKKKAENLALLSGMDTKEQYAP